MLIHLKNQIEKDIDLNQWSPHAQDNPDQITPTTLLSLFPEDFDQTAWTRDFFSTARLARDFSLISMMAIHTGQWNRIDILPIMATLQGKANKLLDAKQAVNS